MGFSYESHKYPTTISYSTRVRTQWWRQKITVILNRYHIVYLAFSSLVCYKLFGERLCFPRRESMVQGIPAPAATTILIVEDDEDTREFLTLAITTETPYHVFSLGSATETFQRLNEIQAAKPALLILDYRLTSMTALELYDRLCVTAELKTIPTIIITADHLDEETQRALAERNLRLLEKPFDLSELIPCIGQAVQPGVLLVIDTQETARE